jgi:hypothetical protein
MKLKELFEKHEKSSVLDRLFKCYNEQEKNETGYLLVLERLLNMEPADCEGMILHIEHVKEDYGDFLDEWEDVHGKNGQMLSEEFPDVKEDCEVSWALEFQPWNKWLDMEIDQKTLDKYDEQEILARVLFEMTFIGFDEKTIQEELEIINDAKDEVLDAKPTEP